jgi:hypothetical protein
MNRNAKPTTIRALTLHRPWAWAIAHNTKRVENRTWEPPKALVGQLLAIHAGQRWDADAAEWIDLCCMAAKGEVPPKDKHPTGIVAVARLSHVALDGGAWFVGPVGWVLDDVVALPEPIDCKGKQGLWTPPNPQGLIDFWTGETT